MSLKVAYLVNQYPKVSHAFIRREIHALEECGVDVERFTVREAQDCVDPLDVAEAARTTVLLRPTLAGGLALLGALAERAVRAPLKLSRAAAAAWRLGAKNERGRLVHLAYLGEAALLTGHLRREGVGHVHAHFGTNSTTVALLCELLGGPGFSFTAHGPEEFDKVDSLALDEKIARARFVVGISSFGRSQLLRRTASAAWPKVKVVPCGVDDSYLREDAPAPIPAAPRLVCVGRLCEQKGQLLLLEACARVVKQGQALELVLVGDGEMRGEVEAFIRTHGLAAHVRITGWASGARVREELLAARALVLPSFAEGLPVVIMEALALGRPVLSTFVAGIPELVENAKTGWLVPAGDVLALERALNDVLTQPNDALTRMGQEGRRRVLERHDARKAGAQLAELFAAAR